MRRPTLSILSVLSVAIGCSDAGRPTSTDTASLTLEQPSTARAGAVTRGTSTVKLERHPRRFSPAKRPAGVPDGYVLTRNGFMHPSCVFRVAPDETLDHDGSILGPDGAVREVMPPCPYERYGRDGRVITRDESSSPAYRPHATYDGWIVFYEY
jgi:hypothetical protein